MENNERKTFLQVGSIKNYNVKVYLDDFLKYSGNINDAPSEIKELKYSKINIGSEIYCYTYSELQDWN